MRGEEGITKGRGKKKGREEENDKELDEKLACVERGGGKRDVEVVVLGRRNAEEMKERTGAEKKDEDENRKERTETK